jgi:hypothetical protein
VSQVLVVAAGGAEDLYRRAVRHGQNREVALGVTHCKAEYSFETLLHRLQRKARSGQTAGGDLKSLSGIRGGASDDGGHKPTPQRYPSTTQIAPTIRRFN